MPWVPTSARTTSGANRRLPFVRSLARVRLDLRIRRVQGLGLRRVAHRHAFGAHEAHVGDAEEAEERLQVALLVVQEGEGRVARVSAATAGGDDHRLAAGEADRALLGVL